MNDQQIKQLSHAAEFLLRQMKDDGISFGVVQVAITNRIAATDYDVTVHTYQTECFQLADESWVFEEIDKDGPGIPRDGQNRMMGNQIRAITKEQFHPCPGSLSYDAWMNIILTEEEGYKKNVMVSLKQYELHNLILLLWGAAKEKGGETQIIHLELAEKLDAIWKKSLGG